MSTTEIEARVASVVEQCRQFGIPEVELVEMLALAKAGEPGIALENLCTQLFEYDAVVPTAVVNELKGLGDAMGLNEKYWMRLERT